MKNISYCVYHNPMCSKSKQSLELLNKRTNNFYIIEYLKVKINNQALKKSIQCLVLPYYDIIRDQNIIFKNMNIYKITLTIDQITNLIIENPILLQRPLITKYKNKQAIKSIIGRPPEKINLLFDN